MKTKTETMSPERLALVAALLGYSNCGQGTPEKRLIEWAIRNPSKNVGSVITVFAAQLCENDEMLDGFIAEAKSWVGIVKRMRAAKTARLYPDVWAISGATAEEIAEWKACPYSMTFEQFQAQSKENERGQ